MIPIVSFWGVTGIHTGSLDTDMSDCQGLWVTFVHEIRTSEPLGGSRELSLLLFCVERPGQGTESLGADLGSSWKAGGHSPVSALLYPGVFTFLAPFISAYFSPSLWLYSDLTQGCRYHRHP